MQQLILTQKIKSQEAIIVSKPKQHLLPADFTLPVIILLVLNLHGINMNEVNYFNNTMLYNFNTYIFSEVFNLSGMHIFFKT